MKDQASQPHQACAQWSNRILIALLVGMIYLTLFPFRIDFAAPHPFQASPFLPGKSVETSGPFSFFPAGLLLVVIARKPAAQKSIGRFLLLLGLFLAPVLFEFILVRVSGRAISAWQVSLCFFLTLLGVWLMNADRHDGVLLRAS